MGWVPLASTALSLVAGNASRNSAASQAADASAQGAQRAIDFRDSNIKVNRADQVGPNGSITFGTGPDGQLVQTTKLSPENQQVYDNLQKARLGLSSGVGNNFGTGLDTSGLPAWQNVLGRGATNLMTHDWLSNAGNANGIAVADAGSRASFAPAQQANFDWNSFNASNSGQNGPQVTPPAPPQFDAQAWHQSPGGPQTSGEAAPQTALGAGGQANTWGTGGDSQQSQSPAGLGGGGAAPPQFGQVDGDSGIPRSSPPQFDSQGWAQFQAGKSPATPAAPAAAPVDPYKVRDTFDTSGVTTKLPTSIDDASRRRVEEALMSRLNPQLQQDEAALRTRLLNSGIEVGTDAYSRELALQGQRANDARMQAVLAGGQEESRQAQLLMGLNDQQFKQALATGKFGQDADIAMANNATSRSNAGTAAGATLGAAGIAASGAMDRLKMQLEQQSKEFNVNTGFKAAEFNNNLRNQQLAEQVLMRREPLSELAALSQIMNSNNPRYDASYYTDSARPAGTPQQPASGGNALTDITGGVGAINNLWNMKWS